MSDDSGTATNPLTAASDEITDQDFAIANGGDDDVGLDMVGEDEPSASPFPQAGDVIKEQTFVHDGSESAGEESLFLSEGSAAVVHPDDKKQEQRLDHKETRMVNSSKLLVYLIILLSAAACGGLTYWFVRDEEKRFYEDEFVDLAVDIFDYIDVNLNKLQESAHAVSGSWTSRGTFPVEGADYLYSKVYAEAQEEDEEEDDDDEGDDDEGDDLGANSTETDEDIFGNSTDTNSTETDEEEEEDEIWAARLSPNMTFPNFALVVGNLAQLSKAELLFVAPLVREEEVEGWQEYAVEHQGWIQQDLIVQQVVGVESSSDEDDSDESGEDDSDEDDDEGDESGEDDSDEDDDEGDESDEDDEGDEDGEDDEDDEDDEDGDDGDSNEDSSESDSDSDDARYRVDNPGSISTNLTNSFPGGYKDAHIPLWQLFPTPMKAEEAPVMWDMMGYSWFRDLFDKMLETKSMQLSPPLVEDVNDIIRYQEDDPPDDPQWKEPKSLLIEPIFDRLDQEEREVAGVVVAVIEWTDYIDEDFGDKDEGLVIDIEYQCRENGNILSASRYSFTKDGVDNEFLGTDYVHDSKYSHMAQRYKLDVEARAFKGAQVEGGDDSDDEDDDEDDEDSDDDDGDEDGDGEEDDEDADDEEDDEEDGDDEEDDEDDEEEDGDSDDDEEDDDSDDDEEDDDSDDEETELEQDGDLFDDDGCSYVLSVHATKAFVENYETKNPRNYTIIVCAIFLATVLVFILYDFLVQYRNRKVVNTAERSTAIVENLFPKNVADQMMEEEDEKKKEQAKKRRIQQSTTAQALAALGGGDDVDALNSTSKKPIADLYTDTSILFADIAGFTAWSSQREPQQVFHLLETIFNSYDKIAERRRIFKVETVGDCYVAVCGLPTPNKDHALAMCRFAWECLLEMGKLMGKLEVDLGPDTTDLNMRIGIHSGSVTAGVLRGQKARFQLFGDSMNKASRIETTGMPGRVHLSQETAQLLIARGKKHWVTEREDKVKMKGLTEQTTYWLNAKGEGSAGDGSNSSFGLTNSHRSSSTKSMLSTAEENMRQMRPRLVEWNAKVLSEGLQKIVALRKLDPVSVDSNEERLRAVEVEAEFGKYVAPTGAIAFQTVPKDYSFDTELPELDSAIGEQLRSFVHEISNACSMNFYHNFEHVSHMVLSVTRVLRFMDPSADNSGKYDENQSLAYLDDPLTHFVLLLGALIQDVQHPGVANEQLAKEGNALSTKYNGSNIVERNALDAAWDILKQDEYLNLRRAIYQTEQEFELFRELLVRSILVTDASDKDLQSQTVDRWAGAFGSDSTNQEAPLDENQRKTAIFEHVSQVTNNIHAMQHWKIYQRWGGALFNEYAGAYEDLRIDQDPTEFWFKRELELFDSYVLPLARRVKEAVVLNTWGEELFQNAWFNRCEWEEKGENFLLKEPV